MDLLDAEVGDKIVTNVFAFAPTQVRFDDTNPTKEKDEYTQNIIKDMQTLGLKYKEITYTSDYFPQVGPQPHKHTTSLAVLYNTVLPASIRSLRNGPPALASTVCRVLAGSVCIACK
jgi:hypothetical protein